MTAVVKPLGAIIMGHCEQEVPDVCLVPKGERGPVLQYEVDAEVTTACRPCSESLFSTGEWVLHDDRSGWADQLREAESAIAADPSDPELYRRAAYVALHLNDFPRALKHDQEAARLKPNHQRAWTGIVVAASLSGDVETAASAFLIVRDLGRPGDYSDIEASFYFGQLLLQIEKVNEAAPLLRAVAESKADPNDLYMQTLRDRATTYLKALRGEESPYLETWMLHTATEDDAVSALRRHFGDPSDWSSAAIRRLLGSDFQRDWQIEAGHWVLAAEEHGYAESVVRKAVDRGQRAPTPGRTETKLFLNFLQEMAEAMAAYWFLRTGWSFDAWNPPVAGADVDFRVRAPDGTPVSIQVKAPDEHGKVVNHKIQGGEFDSRVRAATDKGCVQLPRPAAHPGLIVVIANRNWPLTAAPRILESHLVGGTTQYQGTEGLFLHDENRGLFFTPNWDHCSGVVMLHYVRGVDTFSYANVTLLNPNAQHPCKLEWFMGARVCYLDGDRFRWRGGKPKYSIISDGTHLTDDRPW